MINLREEQTDLIEEDKPNYHSAPIDEPTFYIKINFISYLKMIGVPDDASLRFHIKLSRYNLDAAISEIKPFIKHEQKVMVLDLIERHCQNAIQRRKKFLDELKKKKRKAKLRTPHTANSCIR